MDIIHAVVLGIVEGITEFLPISSTGHMVLVSRALRLDDSDFLKSFEIIIQLGAICAVLVLYWRKLFMSAAMVTKVCVAFVPTAVIGLSFFSFIKHHLIGNVAVVLWALFIGGLLLILFEYIYEKRGKVNVPSLNSITYTQAIVVGFFQAIAIVPGVSRSAATIVGGLLLGIERKTIVEFSFLLAIPTLGAATALDFAKNASSFSTDQFYLLAVGFVTAFIVAIAAIKFLLHFISQHSFSAFGVYRVLIAALCYWYFF